MLGMSAMTKKVAATCLRVWNLRFIGCFDVRVSLALRLLPRLANRDAFVVFGERHVREQSLEIHSPLTPPDWLSSS